MSLLPHHKLDWNLARLEKQLEATPGDAAALLELAGTCLSRAAFHGGGERWFERANQAARQLLKAGANETAQATALAIASACHIGVDRLEAAKKLVDDALTLAEDLPLGHYVLGLWHQAAWRELSGRGEDAFEARRDSLRSDSLRGEARARRLAAERELGRQDLLGRESSREPARREMLRDPSRGRHQALAVKAAETACRLAPEAWEPHALLATLLWERAAEQGGPARAPRLLERSQFHTVRALELGPAPDQEAALWFHLAVTCTARPGSARADDEQEARGEARGEARREGRGEGRGESRGESRGTSERQRPPVALEAASKLFTRLLDDPRHRERAQYYLGVVNYQIGRYKNAVLYLRQHLDRAAEPAEREGQGASRPGHGGSGRAPELRGEQGRAQDARAHGRIAMAYLKLGELSKARDAASRALALDPGDVQARWTLGSALAAEGREEEAQSILRAILQDAPDHLGAFSELVRLREQKRDVTWLHSALRSEVKGYDRLPVTMEHAHDTEPARTLHPRATTRERIRLLTAALCRLDAPSDGGDTAAGQQAVPILLEAIDLTTDERLRFQLWEVALEQVCELRAQKLREALARPGLLFSGKAGREVLALARAIPEELLVAALQIDEEDLRRAAVERHGPARDVGAHRRAIDLERREARAWQALLLLAIASHGNRQSRNLLVLWATEADPDLADAARAALVMLGDAEAAEALMKRARARGAANLVDAMVAQVQSHASRTQTMGDGAGPFPVRPLAPGEDRACSACHRRPAEVGHLMVGAKAALCDRCLAEIATHRRELETEDPEVVCALSGRGRFETQGMYIYKDVPVCREVLDQGLGWLERETVERFLAAL